MHCTLEKLAVLAAALATLVYRLRQQYKIRITDAVQSECKPIATYETSTSNINRRLDVTTFRDDLDRYSCGLYASADVSAKVKTSTGDVQLKTLHHDPG